jgi:hypothetical protein
MGTCQVFVAITAESIRANAEAKLFGGISAKFVSQAKFIIKFPEYRKELLGTLIARLISHSANSFNFKQGGNGHYIYSRLYLALSAV